MMRSSVGERLLTAKLLILNGTGVRPPSLALGILTGRLENEALDAPRAYQPAAAIEEPVVISASPVSHRQYAARTVYLSARHLRDVDQIIDAWQQVGSRRLTRSAVLRRAIEHVRAVVDADPAKSLLENQ